jgi:serine/threonine protein kinase
LRHFFGDIEPLIPEISSLLSLSHPNILHFLCGFTDEENKECFLVMELMTRDLCCYIRETCGLRKRIPFPLPIAVDLMLQIAEEWNISTQRKSLGFYLAAHTSPQAFTMSHFFLVDQ